MGAPGEGQPLQRCSVCNGSGRGRCDCWPDGCIFGPADCVFGCEETDCSWCDGSGFADVVEKPGQGGQTFEQGPAA